MYYMTQEERRRWYVVVAIGIEMMHPAAMLCVHLFFVLVERSYMLPTHFFFQDIFPAPLQLKRHAWKNGLRNIFFEWGSPLSKDGSYHEKSGMISYLISQWKKWYHIISNISILKVIWIISQIKSQIIFPRPFACNWWWCFIFWGVLLNIFYLISEEVGHPCCQCHVSTKPIWILLCFILDTHVH